MIDVSSEWVRAGLTILFGALAGGVTNRIAVWMLFHPYEPPRLLGRPVAWLQGAVPKNQRRLASSIGRVVGGTLLTPEDIAGELRDAELQRAFHDRLRDLVVGLVEEEQPALADLLPPGAIAEVEKVLEQLLAEGRGQLRAIVESPEFETEARRFMTHLQETLSDEPLSIALDGERAQAIRDGLDAWLTRLAESEALERTVRRHLEQGAGHLLQPGRTLEELIPPGLVTAVERAINDYLPIAMERLGRLLEDPEARGRVDRFVHELLERFMRDLRFHQRVVAKLIITEETVTRVLETLEEEGAERMGELLQEAEVQAAMARSVNEAIVEWLRRPAASVFGAAEDPQVQSALDSATGWIVRSARDPGARGFLLDQLEEALGRLGERSWADALRIIPAERIGPWLAVGMRSEPGRALLDTISEGLTERILHRPIGRLSRFLREDAAERLADALAPPAWEWVARQVPEVAERIRISERIEEKIRAFPLQRLEGLIRDVSQRELDLIIRLGYILGAMIGTALVGITALIG